MTLSDLSIKRPVFAWMFMAALIVFGLISFFSMGVSQLPDVEFPTVAVNVTWQGAAPEVMESNVVDVIEQAVMSVQGIRDVTSSVSNGSATITIELELGHNPDVAVQEVQAKLSQAQRLLPKDIDPPIITKVNPAQQPIIWLTLHGKDAKARQLVEYVQDHLEDKFAPIRGVGQVALGGFVAPNLRIWVDSDKLINNELTVSDVMAAIQNEHSEIPAGRIETPLQEQAVRAMGEARTAQEFDDIVIAKRNGQPNYKPIYLKDVATSEDGLDDVRRISRSDGTAAIGMGIQKQIGSNEVEVSHGIIKKWREVQKQIPPGMKLDMVINRTKFIEDSIKELNFILILSAIVTSLVCWIFLGSWTATLNILMAIPTSIIGTFIIIRFLGFTLNTFTVLGLSLAIGIVVDDAIMVLENIVRYREQGIGRLEAAQRGARQITFAALATTAAIIAIFLPVAFMSGIIGQFFYQFGVTICVAVALSLLEALMLTPMRCSQFLRVGPRVTTFGRAVDQSFHWLADHYRRALNWALHHRKLVIVGSLIIFGLSLVLVGLLRKEFVPPQDQSMFLCNLKTPVGSSIDYTNERFKEAEKFVMSRPEVQHYFAAIGGFGGGLVNQGIIFVTFKSPHDRPIVPPNKHRLSQAELMVLFRKEFNKIPHVKAFIQDLSLSGFSAQRGYPIEMTVQGPNWEKLWQYADRIRERMSKSKLLVDVDTDYQAGASEVRVIPDRIKAAEHGVSVEVINQTVNALIGGEKVSQYTHNDKRYDVKVRLISQQRLKPQDITNLWVWNNRGELVQLKDLVTIEQQPTAVTVTRRDRERSITIFANTAPGKSQAAAMDEAQSIAKSILPQGYHAVYTGSAKAFQESNQGIIFVFILGIVVAYMVLASQFNSYVHPLSVLMALPFSVSGALVALWLGGQSLNVYSMIGIVLLMGIVKKNSILLVDFTNHIREGGKGVMEALLEACPIRLRPILMTSLATITAAIPPALAIGPGAEVRIPMSIAVIGGVIVSTLLTLFVVPCVYSLLVRFEYHQHQGLPKENSLVELTQTSDL
ncbi:MAG: efflux RND transporter permease subunit [Candidatus Omnitrophica bacterium]|nr:efflux RND transporter permease subunit [Candidatus Omnitrophota bacterium]